MRMMYLKLFTCLMIGLTSTVQAEDEKAKKKEEKKVPSIAHIKLSGSLDEGVLDDSPFGAAKETLWTKLERIAKAKKDPNIKALYVEFGDINLGLFGFAKVEEVRKALLDFRAAGKKVYGYAESLGGIETLIAFACDEIAIPESGEFGFLGLRIEMSFYKDLMDKFGVKGDFLTMGEAKGAADSYTRTSMSPENRKQYNLVLDDLYNKSILEGIVGSRPEKKWTVDQVKAVIDGAPYAAAKAKEIGLVDTLAYQDDFEKAISKKTEDGEIAKNYGKAEADKDENPLAAFMKMMSPTKKTKSRKAKIAIIYAVGEINTGKGGSGGLMGGESIGSTTMVEAIKLADKDPTVKAIVLRVDSPGGSALASDLIWHALKECKKPTIATMGDVAASGGYYISMGCKKVYAEPGTLTGSIGVIGGKIALGGLYEWAGIKSEVLTRGANTGAMSGLNPFSEGEKKSLMALMQAIYDQFLDRTLENRKANGVAMTKEQLLKLAGGRIWTGRQALEAGLVDKLGTLGDALVEAKKMAGLDSEPEYLFLPEKVPFLESFLEDFSLKLNATVPGVSKSATFQELKRHWQFLDAAQEMTKERAWLRMPEMIRIK
jgi:protease IV